MWFNRKQFNRQVSEIKLMSGQDWTVDLLWLLDGSRYGCARHIHDHLKVINFHISIIINGDLFLIITLKLMGNIQYI